MRRNQDYLDDAVAGIGNGVHDGRRGVSRAMDDMAETMTDWRDQAAPTLNRLTDRATDAARDGADWVRDRSGRVRGIAARASDRTATYVRDEPLRSALMAVAAGTVIYALMRMLRGRDRD